MKIGAFFLSLAAATPCPSSTCWTYDSVAQSCTLDSSCVSVTCTDTAMVLGAKPDVLGGNNWGPTQVDAGWNTVADASGFYSYSCDLSTGANDCGAPTFENDANGDENLVFTYELLQHGNVRTRTTPLSSSVALDNGVTIITSPHGVGVTFKCFYLSSVSVTAVDFAVTPVKITGAESGVGTLDSGFHLQVGPTPIILGEVVTVTATWDVTIASVSYHFTKCEVSHGSSAVAVAIIKDACIAVDLGTTSPANGIYQYKTFHIDGETGTLQRMTCELRICDGAANCAVPGVCPTNAGYGYALP